MVSTLFPVPPTIFVYYTSFFSSFHRTFLVCKKVVQNCEKQLFSSHLLPDVLFFFQPVVIFVICFYHSYSQHVTLQIYNYPLILCRDFQKNDFYYKYLIIKTLYHKEKKGYLRSRPYRKKVYFCSLL